MPHDEEIPTVADLLSDLTPAQRAAVESDAAPLCILASAGAGKTRVLTRRMVYRCRTGRAAASHTLALTFTRKAAGELRGRLAALGLRGGVATGTFHAHAAAQLQRWWADRGQVAPTLLDRKSRLLGPLVAGRPGLDSAPLSEIASSIEWAQARAVEPDDLEEAVAAQGRRLPPGVTAAGLASLHRRYGDEKRRRGLVDFDDLLALCVRAIETDEEFARAQRWRWRHVYVDEFQDLNPLQFKLLRAWLGDSGDLCVVGDPNQAIYGWNGGDPTLLERLPRIWPATATVRLDTNHRSTDQIVRVAASVLGAAGADLDGSGRSGPAPVVRSHPSESAEASAIASEILQSHAGGLSWSSMAVLARTNAQLAIIALGLTSAGVPCWSAPTSGALDDPGTRSLLDELESCRQAPLRLVLADLEEKLRDGSADRAAASALVELGRSFLALQPDAAAADWLRWIPAAGRPADRSAPADTVTLTTFHRAKGLEWPEVWVAGVEEGLVPMARSATGRAETEERQLLYVALTRGEHRLHVSWARTRRFREHPVPRQPSRWLADVAEAIAALEVDGDAEVDVVLWRRRLAEQKAALGRSPSFGRPGSGRPLPEGWPLPDPALRQSVRDWRLRTARHSGVPPHAVLHDATVEAVASLKPRTAEDLLKVPGFGPVKAHRYGPDLLELIRSALPEAVPAQLMDFRTIPIPPRRFRRRPEVFRPG